MTDVMVRRATFDDVGEKGTVRIAKCQAGPSSAPTLPIMAVAGNRQIFLSKHLTMIDSSAILRMGLENNTTGRLFYGLARSAQGYSFYQEVK